MDHAMAYDSKREVVLLFGGNDRDEHLQHIIYNAIWEWDSETWESGPENHGMVRSRGLVWHCRSEPRHAFSDTRRSHGL